MSKKKKKIRKTNKTNEDDEIVKIQNNLKNSIKTLFISDKKKKAIDEYVQLTTRIREEYAKLQQENNQLKIELHKYKEYVEKLLQKSYARYQNPRRFLTILILQRYVDVQKKIYVYIVYEDELDGPNDKLESPNEEEQEEN